MGNKLHQRIEVWKKLLLDFGKRNKLINFIETKRSNVNISSPAYETIFEWIAIQEKEVKFPYSKKVFIDDEGEETYDVIIKGDVETTKTIPELQKTLKALRYRANTSIEEQGINTLFLAFGMLKWKEKDDSSQILSSPLVLVPVRLTIESLTSPYILVPHEDEIVINPTLLHKLENDFGLVLPEFDSSQDSLSDYFDKCEKTIENKGWTIERCAHLANLSFLKINMYKDLERNEDRLSSNPIVAAIAGEAETINVPEELNNFDHDKQERPIDVFQVVDADSSQQDAILLSKKGVSYVLQGPPGTGKSQTITNIISEALADGKKVLFVSEKMAALQVVYNRLSKVGLSDYCFTLHSHKANKKEILRELANSISVDRTKVRDEALAQLDLLERKREALNEYQEQLHTPCSALNVTIFNVNGKLSKLKNVPEIIFPIPDVEKTDINELNNRTYLLGELSKTIGKRSEDYEKNVWRGASVEYLTNELRHDIDSKVAEIVPQLHSLDGKITECSSKLNLAVKHSIAGKDTLMEILGVLKNSPLIPVTWISDDINELLTKTEEYRKASTLIKKNHSIITEKYRQDILEIDCGVKNATLVENEKKVLSAFVCNNKNELVDNLANHSQILCSYIETIEGILSLAEETANELGIEAPKTISQLDIFANKVADLISVSSVKPTENWFKNEKYNQLKSDCSKHKELHEAYRTQKASILDSFDKEILCLEYYPILQRFRGEYDTFLRIFKSQYRKDIKLLRGYSKNGEKLGYDEATSTLNLLKEIAEANEKISLIANQCKEDYGKYYQGVDTNWEILQGELDSFEKCVCSLGVIPQKLKQLLLDGKFPLHKAKQFVTSYTSLDISQILSDISHVLLMDVGTEKPISELLETIKHSVNVSNDFLTIYSEIRGYRKGSSIYTEILEDLKIIVDYQKAVNSLESQQKAIQDMFAFYYNGIETDWDVLYQALCFAKDLKLCAEQYSLPDDLIKKICSDATCVDYCRKTYDVLSRYTDDISKPYNWFSSLFEEKDKFRDVNLLDFIERLMSCKRNKQQLEEWVDYKSNRKRCAEAGLSPYVEQIDKVLIDNNYIVDAYLKRFYRLWLDKIMLQFPAVRDFRGRVQEQNIREFNSLDKEQFKIAQARVRERLASRIPDFNSVTTSRDEIGILKRELNKQRRIMPLRKLFMSIPNLLTTLRPCFMMSPLSVSVFLEANSYEFDLVVFDEASQVHTEDAIGAIMRGKQVIIVGDTKQLPPTNFFATSLNDDDFDVDTDEIKDSDAGAYESILDEAVTVLPERSLRWHYRSRDEHLIAFSNIKIYNSSLITFPSSIEKASDIGVEYVYVKDGVYDRSSKRNNPIEAKRVAELIFQHFKKYPNRSLGVVTFSEAQQNAVDMALRQMRLKDDSLERFFNEDNEEPFFIKNLENVQGDERDTIIFSIGYAKDSHGVMYMNFGPLSRDGGYRRLNVAITRAKYNVKLVGSIVPADIDLSKTSSEGVKLLRSYIDYAQRGIIAIESELKVDSSLNFDSPFEESVYDFLSSKGYDVITQVGCSGYRIDMAIKHPTKKGEFAIGIECDGATYHSSRTARERDRLRQTVLEDMGWTIYRIWSTDWIKNQESEENKLIEAIERALNSTFDESKESSLDVQEPIMDIEEIEEVVAVEETDEGYSFDSYQKANLYDYLDCDVSNKILNVIKIEQPIHFEELCRRLAPIWGNQKVTNVIRNEVNYYFRSFISDNVMRKGDFVTLAGFDDLKVRVPGPDDEVRKIEYICDEELILAMKTIVSHSFGITPDALIIETARAFGYKRTGANITNALKRVYRTMLKNNIVREIDGKVNVIE